jgi:hypothetical protein
MRGEIALVVASFVPALTLQLLACTSAGTNATIPEAGSDGTVTGDDAAPGEAATDAGDEGDATFNPCYPVVPAQPFPSDNCVFAGPCPEDCLMSTASAYACLVTSGVPGLGGDASPVFPSVFTAPIGVVNVIATATAQYPWDASAYVSCAPLSCVRWSTGDHVGGGSAWPGDPCGGDAGTAVQAWTCPGSPGVVPPPAGCINAGPLAAIGGAGTGIPQTAVWCCPPPPDAGSEEGDGGDAGASDAPTGDATTDGAASAAADGGAG